MSPTSRHSTTGEIHSRRSRPSRSNGCRGGWRSKRYIEATGVPRKDFQVGSTAEFPNRAKVTPPAPFSGKAYYSKARGTFTGTLSADFFGKRVRLAGPKSKAGLINFDPGV